MVRLHTRETRIILWPIYFDRRYSRRKGRRVPSSMGLARVTFEEMVDAARRAGLKFEADGEARHPSDWWERKGRILVISDMPKTKVIKAVAGNLRREE
ncbi:MAG: hypothetical protein J7L61_00650 [Thermoplasmata archaeon]|nr:hypothetical protein [Thermoplasmata archaeon]